jgi:beta-phosphoglucomutase-like phosphatase (HAD superfamily)
VVEATLGAIGLRDAFGVVVSGEQVRDGKPAPEIYLLAAERLGVDPSVCVAIEDSANGVRAARAAGMACLGIVTAYSSREQLRATRAVESLVEITPADLAAMSGATR